MSTAAADPFAATKAISRAVLYEGYLLYPYRSSALKNRQRWMFGRLLPQKWCLAHGESESWRMQIECLLTGSADTTVEIQLRFLQLTTGDDALERQVTATVRVRNIADSASRIPFHFDQLQGELALSATVLGTGLYKLTLGIENLTAGPIDCDVNSALTQALLSAHALLYVEGGEFLSLIDPPEDLQPLAATCRNVGAWPVLVGTKPGAMLLAAPIILYDYPQIAPESPGDLFDGTEIDEILSLRIQTLTDDEKHAMSAAGHVVGEMLQRTEGLSQEQQLQMHAQLRKVATLDFRPGDRVRLRPSRCADALDLLLAGQTAAVVAVERDFEGGVHLAVVIDDDPGRDFGVAGLPGHRFFFRREEVERL
jgi:hydrogenase maturation protease